jgi:Coenzyme PQQ synthesis protein D (PqqD)
MHRTFDFVRSTHNQDGGTVLDLRNGRLFRLNFTASLIWERLRNGQPQLEIAKAVADHFGISEDAASRRRFAGKRWQEPGGYIPSRRSTMCERPIYGKHELWQKRPDAYPHRANGGAAGRSIQPIDAERENCAVESTETMPSTKALQSADRPIRQKIPWNSFKWASP